MADVETVGPHGPVEATSMKPGGWDLASRVASVVQHVPERVGVPDIAWEAKGHAADGDCLCVVW